jgi:hypothetical protein
MIFFSRNFDVCFLLIKSMGYKTLYSAGADPTLDYKKLAQQIFSHLLGYYELMFDILKKIKMSQPDLLY